MRPARVNASLSSGSGRYGASGASVKQTPRLSGADPGHHLAQQVFRQVGRQAVHRPGPRVVTPRSFWATSSASASRSVGSRGASADSLAAW